MNSRNETTCNAKKEVPVQSHYPKNTRQVSVSCVIISDAGSVRPPSSAHRVETLELSGDADADADALLNIALSASSFLL
jgi:hypothetical protein